MGEGQEPGEVGHPVGSGSHGHRTIAHRPLVATQDGGGVELGDAAADFACELLVAEPVEHGRVADLGLDLTALLGVEAAGLAGDDGGAVLVEPAVAQRLPGGGQVTGEVVGETEELLPAVR